MIKTGQGQLSIIQWASSIGFRPVILHTFKVIGRSVPEKMVFKPFFFFFFFTIYGRIGHFGHATQTLMDKLSFPHPMEAAQIIWFELAQWFQIRWEMLFENVDDANANDGRRTIAYPIRSPRTFGSGELTIWYVRQTKWQCWHCVDHAVWCVLASRFESYLSLVQ